MPFRVTGADGRVLHENTDEQSAELLALRVHEATDEDVTITPFKLDAETWVPDEDASYIYPAPAEPEAEVKAEPEAESKK